jgi:phosphoserine aminotransferase
MERKINFNAGPATLPQVVRDELRSAMDSYLDSGMSILEIPHRGKYFSAIVEEANALVKELCGLNNDFEIIWLPGGGRQIFCMIPMNFLAAGTTAGYILSGFWAEEAMNYANYYGKTRITASSKEQGYSSLPKVILPVEPTDVFWHITTNNTIYGTQWKNIPNVQVQLIADMSSDIFSQSIDYSQFSLFYAAAQKNLGIAGVGMAAVRKDFLKTATDNLPPLLNFNTMAAEKSVVNTANVVGIYTSLLMLRWTKAKGIANIASENELKSNLLYYAVDNNPNLIPYVTEKSDRSRMNVCFNAVSPELEKQLLLLCERENITGIAGHRSVGGFRVSLYNAVETTDVRKLVEIIKNLN